MLAVKSNSRQIPDIETYTADKKYNDLIYSFLQIESIEENLVDGTHIRYVNKKDVSYANIGDKLNISRQTASKYFKNLIDLGLVEEDKENKRYILKYLHKSVASLVPFETLRTINNTLNQNSISVFVYLLKRYIANEEEPFIVTHSQIKKFIGMTTATTSNNNVSSDILLVLQKIGLIQYEIRYSVEDNKNNIFITMVTNVISNEKC